MVEAVSSFSARAKSLYKAIIDSEWDPSLIKNSDTVGKLVTSDEKLAGFQAGSKEEKTKLFDETFHYAIFMAAQSLEEDPDNDVVQTRETQLTNQEVKDFYNEFLRRLHGSLKPSSLSEDDIRRISQSNVVLNKLVEDIVGSNEDLAVNLFREVTRLIQEEHGGF